MKIEVVLPFKVRLAPGKPVREFAVGVHELTDEEAGNWFVKACLKEKRARRLPDDEPVAEPESMEERLFQVFAALKDEDLKADGVPKVAAVEKALGESVTAEQVAAAWARYQQEKD